jgi:PAS domain S-box-containing protein
MTRADTTAHGDDHYRRILDTAPDAMVVVEADGRIAYVNAQTERMFGRPRAELLGSPLEVLIPQRFRGAHGGHLARYFAKPGTRPMGTGLELFGQRADGTEIAIEVSLSPVPTANGLCVAAAIRDISERKRIEALAKLNAERLASAVESIQDAFALFDAQDQLVLCNSTFRVLLADHLNGTVANSSYERVIDAMMRGFDFPDDDARAAFRTTRLARRSEPTVTFDVRTIDGRWLRESDRRTAEGGIVTTIWDLTEDVQHARELSEARRAAEAGSAAKSEFLSSMSHELRTPLNAVLGFAQLLQRDKKEPLSARHKERVDQILKGGEHLLRLIDDILDLSRIEAGGVSISNEPVGVVEVLEEVRATLQPAAGRAGVTVVVESSTDVLPMVSTDRTRFVQILMNFGSNAIKYNKTGGHVVFRAGYVEGSDGGSVDRIRVSVSDDGMGIPVEHQQRLFQPFHRAGQETGPIEGTGIGLAITKRLAELLRGSVGFRSVPGEGSEFWVEMPVFAPPSEDPARPKQTVRPLRFNGARKALILYVEDNPANVRFMEDLLGSFEGIELLIASDAEHGIELARERSPTVILMDINLPGMSGLDALHVLREFPETRSIPVIALTAAASEKDRQRGERAGFYRYLTKPVRVAEFETVLEQVLSSRESLLPGGG